MKHFAIDIDGCLTNGKGSFTSAYQLHLIQKHIQQNKLSAFICTGRSAPYVEAIAQSLNINQWCICENGAYIYQPITDEILYNPLINNDTLEALNQFKALIDTSEYQSLCKPELGKDICISLNPIKGTIEDLYASLLDKIDTDLLYINHSTTAVDITPKGVDKGSALQFLCKTQGFDLSNIISIGDSSGDLPFMTISGFKACPQNASQSVKEICDYVSALDTSEGVLDILQHFDD